MKKYLLGLATGITVTVLSAKYKEQIQTFCDSLLCDCEDCNEKCGFRCKKKN
ncbi:hypothetical protein AAGG74_16680 [Bacillus mexicanus]|uniref:hypothetical protein n=1 Tax=Bacillus mexicanus TaxID=2834415 RepID=UPI003D254583